MQNKNIIKYLSNRLVLTVVTSLLLIFISSFSMAQMSEIADSELQDVTGQAGFASVNRSGNTMKVNLNTRIDTYAELDSLKAGYYNRNDLGDLFQLKLLSTVIVRGPQDDGQYIWDSTANPNTSDWDLDLRNVKMGTSSKPMTMNGLTIRAEYDNIDSSNRKLTKFVIGSPDLDGACTGSMNRLTGICNPALLSGFMGDLVYQLNKWGLGSFLGVGPFEIKRDSFLVQGWNTLQISPIPGLLLKIPVLQTGNYEFTSGKTGGFFLEVSKEKGLRALMGTDEYGNVKF